MTSGFDVLPLTEEFNEEVCFVSFVKDLREEVQVTDQSSLEDNRDVGRVEELYRVGSVSSGLVLVSNFNLEFESLEVDDNEEDNDGCDQVEKVG